MTVKCIADCESVIKRLQAAKAAAGDSWAIAQEDELVEMQKLLNKFYEAENDQQPAEPEEAVGQKFAAKPKHAETAVRRSQFSMRRGG